MQYNHSISSGSNFSQSFDLIEDIFSEENVNAQEQNIELNNRKQG